MKKTVFIVCTEKGSYCKLKIEVNAGKALIVNREEYRAIDYNILLR